MRAMLSIQLLVLAVVTTTAMASPRNADATSAASDMDGRSQSDRDGGRGDGDRGDGGRGDGGRGDGGRGDGDRGDGGRPPGEVRGDADADAKGEGAPGVGNVDEPPVRDVIAAAYRAAGLGTSEMRGLARRARLAGLVPLLTVRTARGTSWHDLEQDVGRSTTLEVRATWRLDRLMFEPRELQVASLEAARRRERRRLAKQVIRAYYAWQRGARADEAAAELDELTDGWFAKAVENRGATSGARTVGRVPARMP